MSKIRILSIETSCDETALSILTAEGGIAAPHFTVVADALSSQAKLHAEYGGVLPNLARREHGKNIIPLLIEVLEKAKLLHQRKNSYTKNEAVFSLLEREEEAKKMLHDFFEQYETPEIDLIAVTVGPGLEPALWVGISVARALALAWNKPIVGVNHMEGHIISPLLHGIALESEQVVTFPAISLLVSGGHTELHAVESWTTYRMLGATRDDAAGEAFDKVARMLGLPYPGGPEISKLAAIGRETPHTSGITFPRPMIHTKDFDFSFSGLKTAVLYTVRDLPNGLNQELKQEIAKEFEDAVVDVLTTKTLAAVEETGAQTIIVGGGVAANKHLRNELTKRAQEKFGDIAVLFPEKELATDNAVMIGMAGYLDYIKNGSTGSDEHILKAQGNLKI